MTKPNFNFSLSVKDLEVIEGCLNNQLSRLALQSLEHQHKNEQVLTQIRELTEVLGKLHKQKNWYRPNKNYIGG